MKTHTIAAWCLLLFVSAAASNAVMDTLSFRYGMSIFPQQGAARDWWAPARSWKNKWKDGDRKQGDAFPLSSTALVAVTGAWHLFKAITIFCGLAALLLPFTKLCSLHWTKWLAILICLNFLYGLISETLFTRVLIR